MGRIFFFLLFAALTTYAQASVPAKDFRFSFANLTGYSVPDSCLQIRIATKKHTQATITFIETGEEISLSLGAGTLYTYYLTRAQAHALFPATGKSSKSIRVQTDEDISLYAISRYDATEIQPVGALGFSYYHLSYTSFASLADGYTIVSTEDNTKIYEEGILKSVLNAGEVYYARFNSEYSGRHITANRPVACFVTHSCANISMVPEGGGIGPLYEQLHDVSLWGNRFFVPVSMKCVEKVRIVASRNNTEISLSNGTITRGSLKLNAGEWMEADIAENGCYIEANNPVGVVSFTSGCVYDNNTFSTGTSMAWIPPIEQFISETLIATTSSHGPTTFLEINYAIIIVPSASKESTGMTTGNGAYTALNGGEWHDHPSGYSSYALPLEDNTEVVYGFKNPHGLIVLCYSAGVTYSYYYVAGTAMYKLNAFFEVNDNYYQTVENETFCDGNIKVKATMEYSVDNEPDRLRWLINGEEQPALSGVMEWEKPLAAGKHSIMMIARNRNGGLDSMSASVTLLPHHKESLTDQVTVGKPYSDNGFNIPPQYSTGTLNDTLFLQNRYNCDSIVVLKLEIICPLQEDTLTLHETVYRGESYDKYGFTLPPHDIQGNYVYQQKLTGIYGCDSTVILNLEIICPLQGEVLMLHETVCQGEHYDEHGFTLPPHDIPGNYLYRQVLTDIYGCDSIITLNLTVTPRQEEENPVPPPPPPPTPPTYAEKIIPSAYFSPNGDGVNDFWDIKNIEYFEVVSVEIYDRSGKQLVRYAGSFTPWDGNYHGNAMPSGDYWYVITLKGENRQTVGHFTLVR